MVGRNLAPLFIIGHAPSEASGAAPGDAGKGKGHMQTVSRPVIEDWQLPPRYRRQMLDEKEIALINVSNYLSLSFAFICRPHHTFFID